MKMNCLSVQIISQILIFLYIGINLALCINPLEIEAIYSEVRDGAGAVAAHGNVSSNSSSRPKRSTPLISNVAVDMAGTEDQNVEIPPANYKRYELPPTENDLPTVVNISIIVMNVSDIRESEQEISIEMNMRTYWLDKRLSSALANVSKTKTLIVEPEIIDKLWHPDLFIDHVKSINQPIIMSKPTSLKIYPDTIILRYSIRLRIKLSCSFNFKYYPADSQTCNVDIKSYAYPSNKMMLQWKESREGKGASFAYDLTNQEIGNYWIRMENPNTFDTETSSGTYSGLRFSIILTRNIESHILQTYAPSFLLVILSWITFFLNWDEIVLRTIVSISSFVMLGILFASVRQSVPNVGYIKAIDIWMMACLLSVAFVIIEIAIVIRIKNMKPKESEYSGSVLEGRDPFSDQNVGYNHFNALRGARGSVATVYYPGNNPQQRRMSTRPGVGLPGQGQGQSPLDESDEEYTSGSGGYIRRPSSMIDRDQNSGGYPVYNNMRRSTIVPGSVGDPNTRMYSGHGHGQGRPLPNPMKQVQFQQQAPLPLPSAPPFRSGSQSTTNLYQLNSPALLESNIKYAKIAQRVDVALGIIIPILFLAFNCLYWPWLFGSSHYFRLVENGEESAEGL